MEGEDREKKLSEEIPRWGKIVFDGKKIQIRLNAHPSIYETNEGEEKIIYRLHFDIRFKKSEEKLDIESRIDDVKELAEEYSSNPTSANAEALAKEAVNAERAFESSFRQSQQDCEGMMNSIFGAENKRPTQKIISEDIVFYEGEDFDAILRLEMCDDCEWNWINTHFWMDGRRNFGHKEEKNHEKYNFEGYSNAQFESEAEELFSELRSLLEQEDFGEAFSLQSKMWALNDAWNKLSNDVWKKAEKEFESKRKSMENSHENNEQYWWIKLEQDKQSRVKEIQNDNYEDRKDFYSNLFSSYDSKEFYYEQIEYEKRLIEEFRVKGEEICDNNKDDNDNGQIDCQDSRCSGKICGKLVEMNIVENKSVEEVSDMYCIANTCQIKEEVVSNQAAVCGNHICEENESVNSCAEDCSQCPSYPALNCSGKIIFSGNDGAGCPLEPICLNETETCAVDSDCSQPLCGVASCIENTCEVTQITQCSEAECIDGDKKIEQCQTGEEVVKEVCSNGLWAETGVVCEEGSVLEEVSNETESTGQEEGEDSQDESINTTEEVEGEVEEENEEESQVENNNTEVEQEEVLDNECQVKSDCGNSNDVCSNGRCVTLPENQQETEEEELVEEEIEEIIEEVEEIIEEQIEEDKAEQAEQGGEQTITGEVISAINSFTSRVGGLLITGFTVEDGDSSQEDSNDNDEDEGSHEEDESSEDEGNDNSDDAEEDENSNEDTAEEDEATTEAEEDSSNEDNSEYEDNDKEDYSKDYDKDKKDDEDDWEERHEKEEEKRRKREQEEMFERCKNDCTRGCEGHLIEPCVGHCVFEDPNNEKTIEECEIECKAEVDFDSCENNCFDKCKTGKMDHDFWKDYENENQHQEHKGVFQVGGGCRTEKGETHGHLWFGGWGDPFDEIEKLKHQYYEGGHADWCKDDLENLIKQRKEFEEGFDQEFVEWFFEKYLASSSENWDSHVSGIYELYWRDVDTSRELIHRMDCLGLKEMPFSPNLINVKYESDYGSLEFWEEIKMVKMGGMEEEVEVITPYMKIWIFPPESFIKQEFQRAMEKGKFPGPSGEDEKMGPNKEEKEEIRQEEDIMEKIEETVAKYGKDDGKVDVIAQIEDKNSSEILFNILVEVSAEDIISMEPMLPENNPTEDVKIVLDYDKLYDIIYFEQKHMSGAELESPEWDKKPRLTEGIKDVANGVRMFFKIRGLINSAEFYPKEAKGDVKDLILTFVMNMPKDDEEKGGEGEAEMDEEMKKKIMEGFGDGAGEGFLEE